LEVVALIVDAAAGWLALLLEKLLLVIRQLRTKRSR